MERVSPRGAVLALDRTPDVSQAVRLGAALVHAGLALDLSRDRSGIESFIEEGAPTTFTRFVGRRAPASTSRPVEAEAELSAWLKRMPVPAYGPVWHDELRHEALKAAGSRLVWGCEIDYSPHSPTLERREIWDHDGAVYGWVTTTVGFRELVEGRTAPELWNEYGAYAGQFAASGLQVRFYES
jgi:hypothetical protein